MASQTRNFKLLFSYQAVPRQIFFLYHKEKVKTRLGFMKHAIIYCAVLLLTSLLYGCGLCSIWIQNAVQSCTQSLCFLCGKSFPLCVTHEDDCISQFLAVALGSWQSIRVASAGIMFGSVSLARKYFGTLFCVVWSSRRACGMCSLQMEVLQEYLF